MECASVLLIEDEEDIRYSIAQILELEGYQVISAANGEEGLKLIHTAPSPCLILLDLMMPVMNGWEFLKRKRQNDVLAVIPIVIVSALGDEARGLDIQAFVKKPIDLDVLLKQVKKYCGSTNLAKF